MRLAILMITLLTLAKAQTMAGGSISGGAIGNAACGPPNYSCGNHSVSATFALAHVDLGTNACDWSSLATLQTCGNLLGANRCVTPGTFGAQRVCRLTDAATVAASSIWLTADDGFPSLFNTNDTALVLKIQGGARRIVKLNAVTMQATLSAISVASDASTWSIGNPAWLYQLTGADNVTLQRVTMDFNADTSTVTTIKDLGNDATCFGASFTAQSTTVLLSPPNDQVFTLGASVGNQNTGVLAVSYNTSTGQCTVLNTQTGAVTRNGVALGTIAWAERGTFHEVYQSPNPRYAMIVLVGVTGPEIWDLQNPTQGIHCPNGVGNCDGHNAWGLDGLIRGKSLLYHSYANPAVPQTVNLPSPPDYPNNHPSWNNAHVSDTSSYFLNKTQDASPTGDLLATFPVPFYDEVWMLKADGSGTVSRQAHTYSSGLATQFDVSNAVCSISQTGRFAVCSTDWMGTLGAAGGGASCTLGVTGNSGCRADDILVELK